jgi:aspartyl-tRNA(Asn)/glutamyl-tRNA(Gln) amidotransferase subunit B
LPAYDAGVLVADKAVADFFEEAAAAADNAKAVSNWIMTEMYRMLSENELTIGDVQVTPGALAELVRLTESNRINRTAAKEVFEILFREGGEPGRIVEERGMAQVSDSGALDALVDQAMAENPKSVADFRNGKEAALKHLMGQVMRLSRGKANPKVVNELLREKLAAAT